MLNAKPTHPVQQPNANSMLGVMDIAPSSIDLFVYSDSMVYPSKELGYALRYIAPEDTWADVYIYPVPDALADKTTEEIVRTMTLSTLEDVEKAQRQGMYSDFEIIEMHHIQSGDRTEGRVYGTYKYRGELASTAIYLTEYEGNLYKIRITQLNTDYDASTASLWDNFANRMYEFLVAHHEET